MAARNTRAAGESSSTATGMQSLTVWVPRSLAVTLKTIARAESNNVSSVVRRLLSTVINQERARG